MDLNGQEKQKQKLIYGEKLPKKWLHFLILWDFIIHFNLIYSIQLYTLHYVRYIAHLCQVSIKLNSNPWYSTMKVPPVNFFLCKLISASRNSTRFCPLNHTFLKWIKPMWFQNGNWNYIVFVTTHRIWIQFLDCIAQRMAKKRNKKK